MNNAGHEGAVVTEKVRQSSDANYGFNAETEKYEDLVAAGVIDPTKVTRTALQNAASIAALLLTTEALVCGDQGREEDPRRCLRAAAAWATCTNSVPIFGASPGARGTDPRALAFWRTSNHGGRSPARPKRCDQKSARKPAALQLIVKIGLRHS